MCELFEKYKATISSKCVKNDFTIGRNDDEDHKIGHQQQPFTLFMNLP